MNDETKEIYKNMNKKKWKDKEDWEKFLDKDRVKELKKQRRRNNHEFLFDPSSFEYMNL